MGFNIWISGADVVSVVSELVFIFIFIFYLRGLSHIFSVIIVLLKLARGDFSSL